MPGLLCHRKSIHHHYLVPPENCDLAQYNLCTTFIHYLQIRSISALLCNVCAISYAYVQVELALLRPPIIFDRLRMPKIDCLTGKQQSSVCL